MLLAVLLAFAATAASQSPKCDVGIGELVPNSQVARELANVIIRSRQTARRRSRYSLHVEKDAAGWVIFQSLAGSLPKANGRTTVTAGGGGLSMRIDRCNGTISDVHYQR